MKETDSKIYTGKDEITLVEPIFIRMVARALMYGNTKHEPNSWKYCTDIKLYKDASANGFINEVKPYWIVPFSYIDEERLILTAMKVTSKTLTLSGIQTQLEEPIESGQATMSEHSRANKRRSLDRLLRENLELKIMLKAAREDVKKVQSALSRGALGAN